MTVLRVMTAFLVALAVAPNATAAESPWPAWVSSLPRAVSESPVAARLPEASSTTSASSSGVLGAADGVEAATNRQSSSASDWAGIWQGWACSGAACDVRLVIDPPSVATAGDGVSRRRLTVAVASSAWSLTEQVDATVIGREWQATLAQGRRLGLRARDDGDLEFGVWSTPGEMLMMGVVSQKPPPYRREVRWIDTPWTDREGGGNGESERIRLEALLHRPAGPGPYPTLVFHHGSTGVGNRPEFFRVTWSSPAISAWFTARGWQVVYPQRRGRGQSGGHYDEGFKPNRSSYSCEVDASLQGAERALADIDLALKSIGRWPDVMAHRLVVGGVSRGGVLAVVQAGREPELAAGVINFVGGWVGERCPGWKEINAGLFASGGRYPRPQLWLYGEGDPYYPADKGRAGIEAFRRAGGQADFRLVTPLDPGMGHSIDYQPTLWAQPVAAYLSGLKAESEYWQLAGTQGVVRVVIVPPDRVRDVDGYRRQIDHLCPAAETCFVNFHTNSTGADVTLPLPDAIAREVTARFRRSAKVGRELFEWNCNLKIEDAPCF